MPRTLLHNALFVVAALFTSVIVATVLLTVAYTFPVSPTNASVADSAQIINSEGSYPNLVLGDADSQLDNYTDSLMILTASTTPSSTPPLVNAMLDAHATFDSDEGKPVAASDPVATLGNYVENPNGIAGCVQYARYWHGYLVLLRPLLAFGIGVGGIRNIIAAIFICSCGAFAALAIYRKQAIVLIPFALFLVSTHAIVATHSLQYASSFVIAVLGSTAVLALQNRSNAIVCRIFLILGILISYFDLLTAPLMTCLLPLLVMLAVRPQPDGRLTLANTLCALLLWGIGYGAMWLAKWLLAGVVLHTGVIETALDAASYRTSAGNIIPEVISANFARCKSSVSTGLIPSCLAILLVMLENKNTKHLPKQCSVNLLSFIIVAAIPLIWMAVLSNHSLIHNFMTYRIACMTMCAPIFFLASLVPSKQPVSPTPSEQNT